MEILTYFENIEDKVIADLKAAEKEILLAMAWFTNKKIFDVHIIIFCENGCSFHYNITISG